MVRENKKVGGEPVPSRLREGSWCNSVEGITQLLTLSGTTCNLARQTHVTKVRSVT